MRVGEDVLEDLIDVLSDEQLAVERTSLDAEVGEAARVSVGEMRLMIAEIQESRAAIAEYISAYDAVDVARFDADPIVRHAAFARLSDALLALRALNLFPLRDLFERFKADQSNSD